VSPPVEVIRDVSGQGKKRTHRLALPLPRERRGASSRIAAGRLYIAYLVLGGIGVVGIVIAGMAGFHTIRLAWPTARSLYRQCTNFFMGFSPLAMAVLFVTGLVIAIVFLGIRSVARQLTAAGRLSRGLRVMHRIELAGQRLSVIDDDHPQAFCLGYLGPQIFVSTGALEQLSPEELRAVVAHEAHHAGRRDPLRLLVGRAVAEALFFLRPLRRMVTRYAELSELAADEAAVRDAGTQPLASALLSFGEHRTPAGVTGIAPERVDHLTGAPARWKFPRPSLISWMAVTVGIFVLAVAGSLLVQGYSLSSTSILEQACFISMTGTPVLAGVTAVITARRRATRRRSGRPAARPSGSARSAARPSPRPAARQADGRRR
jgi:Zn-dependent protease with chaperone function